MDILEPVIGREPEAEKDAVILASSRLPLFIWGRGVMATWVYSWLTENRIAIAGFFTDVPKPKKNEKFYGLDVLSLEAVCAKYGEFNVFVGHAQGYKMMDDLKRQHKNIKNVYAIEIDVLRRGNRGGAQKQKARDTSIEQALLVSHWHLMKYQLAPKDLPGLQPVGFKVFSQFEEDGLLLYIFSIISPKNRRCVEICAGDGQECMSANLIINHGWEALLFDGNEEMVKSGNKFFASHPKTWLYPPKFVHAWITRDNINQLLADNGFMGEIDLLSLDIDGNDYWIWKALHAVSPRVFICETQNAVPHDKTVTQPYSENWHLDAEHSASGFFSVSLAAMQKICVEKQYRLVGINRYGFNAIFMRNDVGIEYFPEISVESALDNPYSRATREAKWPKARTMPWVEV
jgi:hypothetical protein